MKFGKLIFFISKESLVMAEKNLSSNIENNSGKEQEDGCLDIFSKIKSKKNKSIPMVTEKNAPYYNMNFPKRGIAIIFNHEKFNVGGLDSRNGAKADCRNLCDVLSKLDFEVQKHLDLKVCELKNEVREVSRSKHHTHCDCFLMAILSHGERDIIYAKDSAYSLDWVIDQFTPDKCPSLAGKPKIFLIQACRGNRLDAGIDVENIQVDSDVNSYRIPLYADFLVHYSTIPGFRSWRTPEIGSWFIQAFCEQMKQYGMEYDLMTVLTFVNHQVAINYESYVPDEEGWHKKKQVPCITSMLTRLIKFSAKTL